ncbi:hypothetical protein Kpho01_66630 [Kitasatospora phosalacinea]|uniref:Uncharacterized protein n=1 Tax=Kitasatospora phosalacinea TaxID=2065 RepID=A0A9W6PP61_9ACTN|nr:hypothetical protein Kpho01_66630 [Kitasatospora phosalacinea]
MHRPAPGAHFAQSREGALTPANVGEHLGQSPSKSGSVIHGWHTSVAGPNRPVPVVMTPGGATPQRGKAVAQKNTACTGLPGLSKAQRNPPSVSDIPGLVERSGSIGNDHREAPGRTYRPYAFEWQRGRSPLAGPRCASPAD